MTDIEYEWQELWPQGMGSITKDGGVTWDKTKGPDCAWFWPLDSQIQSRKDKWLINQPLTLLLSDKLVWISLSEKKSMGGVILRETWSENSRAGTSHFCLLQAQNWELSFYLGMDLGQCPEINTR